jgi:hypothetical protein
VIAVELVAVVADEPILAVGHRAHARCEPTRLEVGLYGVERLIYLPGIALVVATMTNALATIIPVEHVWHMTVRQGEDVLDRLAQVMT